MTFQDWITSKYPPNSDIDGAWGMLHIITLVLMIAAMVAIAFLVRNRSEKARRRVIIVIAVLIGVFELSRRIINLAKGNAVLNSQLGMIDFRSLTGTLLPRPWCAISCWCFMAAVIVNKKFFYNFTATSSLVCTLIFFAYPMAGFDNKYILFENVYSIGTHTLLMTGSISLITLKFTDFDYKKGVWKELICLAATFAYATFEILLEIEPDPLYFMPDNDAQGVLGLGYPAYLVIYILFLCVYFSAFYLVQWLVTRKKRKQA